MLFHGLLQILVCHYVDICVDRLAVGEEEEEARIESKNKENKDIPEQMKIAKEVDGEQKVRKGQTTSRLHSPGKVSYTL